MRVRSGTARVALVATFGLAATLVIASSCGRSSEGVAETLEAQARRAIASRRWSEAETSLNRLAELRKGNETDVLLRAEVLRATDRANAARELLATIPTTSPNAAQARLLEARVEREQGRLRPAEAALLQALQLDPNLIQAHRELVYIYGMQARRAELNEQFRALARFGRLGFEDLFLWSTSNQDVWINDRILPDLERFLAADPQDRWSRLALAEVFLKAGRHDDAEATLVPLDQSDVNALVLRARLALERSKMDDLRAILDRGPASDPRLARIRGELALWDKDWPRAVRELQSAVALDPTSLQAAQSYALALRQAGDAREVQARGRLDRLRQLARLLESARPQSGPRDRSLPSRLGAACEAVGQIAEARGWYRLAIEVDGLDTVAQQGLYRLGTTFE